MDKETLSNYGWIVICVLVLAVMIALAGPFGRYIATAVENTTEALFKTQQSALSAADMELMEQEFEDMFSDGGSGTETNTPIKFGGKYIATTDNILGGSILGSYYIFYSDGSLDSTYGNESAGYVTYTETEIIPNDMSEGISMVVSSDGTTITQLYNGEIIQVIYTLESAIS